MKKSIGTLILAWAYVLAAGSVSDAAALGEVLDQSFVLARFSSSAAAGAGIGQNVAQTIRVGLSGQLARIEFWAYRSTPDLGDLSLDIRPIDVNGSPIESNAAKFGQITIPHANIATLAGTAPSDIPRYFQSVDLTPLNLYFVAGDFFAINFGNTNPAGYIGVMGDIAFNPGPYVPGQSFLRSNAYNGGKFTPWTDSYPNPGPGPNWVDLGFQTFVLPVPEPSATLLLGIAAFAFYNVRRDRTKL